MKTENNHILKEVRITWEDITTYHGSYIIEETKKLKPMLKRSHGVIVRSDKKYVRIASENTEDKTYRDITVIPRANIKRVYVFPRGEKDKEDW